MNRRGARLPHGDTLLGMIKQTRAQLTYRPGPVPRSATGPNDFDGPE
ncbi:hypothetical protein [Streptomyces sp. NPDC026673]